MSQLYGKCSEIPAWVCMCVCANECVSVREGGVRAFLTSLMREVLRFSRVEHRMRLSILALKFSSLAIWRRRSWFGMAEQSERGMMMVGED